MSFEKDTHSRKNPSIDYEASKVGSLIEALSSHPFMYCLPHRL